MEIQWRIQDFPGGEDGAPTLIVKNFEIIAIKFWNVNRILGPIFLSDNLFQMY